MNSRNYDMPELIAENGESTVRATLETHLISPVAFDILLRDPLTRDDFEAFSRNAREPSTCVPQLRVISCYVWCGSRRSARCELVPTV